MLIQTNGDSISYRIISHNSRTPIVAQATTSKKNYRVVVSYHTIPELQLLHKLRRLKKITESHLDTSHIPVKSAGALLHAWGKAQTAALAVGSQKKKPLVLRRTRRKLPGWRRRGADPIGLDGARGWRRGAEISPDIYTYIYI